MLRLVEYMSEKLRKLNAAGHYRCITLSLSPENRHRLNDDDDQCFVSLGMGQNSRKPLAGSCPKQPFTASHPDKKPGLAGVILPDPGFDVELSGPIPADGRPDMRRSC